MQCWQNRANIHLHLVILQMLLSKATYNWGIHKAILLKEHCSSPAYKWQGPGQEVVQHAPLERAWSFWCCAMQTCKIEQFFAMWSLKVSWLSKITPRFLTEVDGVIVDEPNWMVKSCCRVGVAGKIRSSVFARLSCGWCSFIHAEMSARQPEIHAATVGSSGWNER